MYYAVVLLTLFAQLFAALALTILIECGLSLLFRSRELTYCVLLCNLLTNPPLNLILILFAAGFGQEFYPVVLGILEVTVVFIEAFIITLTTSTKTSKALLLSLFFNASSFGIGLLLQLLL